MKKGIHATTSQGFTLVEALVYLSVLVIVMIAISSFIYWSLRSQTKVKALREVSTNAELVFGYILSEIREANGVYTPTSTFDSHPGQLSLETTKYLPAGETTTYIDFYQCDNQICLRKEIENPVTLTPEHLEVTHFEFHQVTTNSKPSIRVHLILEHSNPQNIPEQEASIDIISSAALRSY